MSTYKSIVAALAFVASYLFFFPSAAFAQDLEDGPTCTENQICVNKSRAKRFFDAATDLRCLQRQMAEGEIDLSTDPYRIIIDEDGRVYAKDKMTLHLRSCGFEWDFIYKPEVKIHRKTEKEPVWGLRFRFRLGLAAKLIPHGDQTYRDPRSLVSPMVLFESFYWRFLHAEAHVGLDTFGVGIGTDLTKNLDLYTGAGLRWANPRQATPVVGLSLSLN